ncbi:uncharacterized protein [Oscarella lobularis]|uniref:uncharacterized protein isoform X2 n=1 Tax=Oscarella lobularis TaxID=121494 RepID=UPI003313F639
MDSSAEFSVEHSSTSNTRLGDDHWIDVRIRNNSHQAIPEQSVSLESNLYYKRTVSVLPAIKPFSQGSIKLKATVWCPGNRRIESLCRAFIVKFHGLGVAVPTPTKIANYKGCIEDYSPQKAELTNRKEISRYNILLFGMVDSGKSSFVNTLLTMLQDESKQKICSSAAYGGTAAHTTTKVHCYNISRLHPNCYFNLWDTWGLDETSFVPQQVKYLVNGQLPLGWRREYSVDEYDNHINRIKTSLTQGMKLDLLREAFQLLVNEGLSPILVLSKVDEMDPALRRNAFMLTSKLEELRQKAAVLFQLPIERVTYTVNYLQENERNWDIEALAYKNLVAALDSCETFIQNDRSREDHFVKDEKSALAVEVNSRKSAVFDLLPSMEAGTFLRSQERTSRESMWELDWILSYKAFIGAVLIVVVLIILFDV